MLTLRNLRARCARLFNSRPKSVRHVPRLEELEGRDVPSLLGNQLFPADNPWNQKITNAPVAATVISRGLSRIPCSPPFYWTPRTMLAPGRRGVGAR